MRLDEQRQKRLEPKRMQNAIDALRKTGFLFTPSTCKKFITIDYKGNEVIYWVYSGWATGKTIKDGRGMDHLLKQLKP